MSCGRLAKIHHIKIEEKYADDIRFSGKNFEVRKNDRDYRAGDILMMEVIGKALLLIANVDYVTSYQQKKNYVVMAISDVDCRAFGDEIIPF